MVWLKRAHRSENSSLFVLWIPLVLLLFLTKIDAKTASTTVSNDNQLAMGLIDTTESLNVGWRHKNGVDDHCHGQKTKLGSVILQQ